MTKIKQSMKMSPRGLPPLSLLEALRRPDGHADADQHVDAAERMGGRNGAALRATNTSRGANRVAFRVPRATSVYPVTR
jgi:hypothetical protein